jgi:hypothetical protein
MIVVPTAVHHRFRPLRAPRDASHPLRSEQVFFKKRSKHSPGDSIEVSDLDGDFLVPPEENNCLHRRRIGITPFRSISSCHTGDTWRHPLREPKISGRLQKNSMRWRSNPRGSNPHLFSLSASTKRDQRISVPNLASAFYVSGPEPMVGLWKNLQQIGGSSRSGSNRIGFPVTLRRRLPDWRFSTSGAGEP